MKKALVLTLTAVAVLGLAGQELLSRHASPERMSAMAPKMPVLAEPPPAPEEQAAVANGERAVPRKMEKRRMNSLEIIRGPAAKADGDRKEERGGGGEDGEGGMVGGVAGGVGGGVMHGFGGKGGAVAAGAITESPRAARAWFPETFLFEPLVVTDEQGRANVPVKVPDRLTTWRVLALAHSREGAQAGALTSFLGTLPTYVEPVTPPFLYAGDEVRLPIQLVNTTEHDVSSPLFLSATGGSLSAAGGEVRVPAGGNVVQYTTLTTKRPGSVKLRAALGEADAVEKSIPVNPAGVRNLVTKGGTLAAPRTFSLANPADTLPGTEVVRLRVFPGALGLVRSELAAAPNRGGVAEDAYLLQLLGEAPALLHALGSDADPAVVRELSLLATQRVMRHARAPSVDTATLLTEAALAHPQSPVLTRLAERLAETVARAQRADGTCEGANGWTLQRLLVTTADCVRAVNAAASTSPRAKQRATGMSVKASGAFERNLGRVTDGYTAAALLSTGLVTGPTALALKKLVLDGLTVTDDGAKALAVPNGVVRADGRVPSQAEATALAILALGDDPVVADLGTTLMAGYSSSWGWGDGRASLLGLRAAVRLFKAPVPAGVRITLKRDGKTVTEGTLDAAALKDVLMLDADATGSVGTHEWTLTAEPAVAGLGYSMQLVAFTTWKAPEPGGLQLTMQLPATLSVGALADVTLAAALPAGVAMKIVVPLAAGVQHDTDSLNKLADDGTVSRFETEDGQVTLHVPPQAAGSTWTASFKVGPTLSGNLQAGPPSLAPEDRPWAIQRFAPTHWLVRER